MKIISRACVLAEAAAPAADAGVAADSATAPPQQRPATLGSAGLEMPSFESGVFLKGMRVPYLQTVNPLDGSTQGLGCMPHQQMEIPVSVSRLHEVAHWQETLLQGLNEPLQRQLAALPDSVRVAALQACLLTPSLWHHVTPFLQDVVDTWPQIVFAASKRRRVLGPLLTLRFVVVSCFDGVRTPLVAWRKMLFRMQELQPAHQYSTTQCFVCEHSAISLRVGELVTPSYVGCPVHVAKSMAELLKLIRNASVDVPSHVLVLMAGLDFGSPVGRLQADAVGKSVLHKADCWAIHEWHSMAMGLQQQFWPRVMAVTQSAKPWWHREEHEEQLDCYFGFRYACDSKLWNKASNPTQWRLNVRLKEKGIAPRFFPDMTDVWAPFPDGSVWNPDAQALKMNDGTPARLSAKWPGLCDNCFRSKQIDGFGLFQWSSLQVRRNREDFRAGVLFFLRHKSMENTPLSEAMTLFPCQKTLDIRDGSHPCELDQFSSACGLHIFCPHCRMLLPALGDAWDVMQAAEVLAQTFEALLPDWLGHEGGGERFVCQEASHSCDRHCKLRP